MTVGKSDSGQGPRADRARAAIDRAARLCPLFPDRPRHRAVCAAARHPVPGARLGRQFGRLLLPRHHRGRPGPHRRVVRALYQRRAQRAARHRCRFRARAARGGDPIRLRKIRPRPRRSRRDRHLLPLALGDPRGRQGIGPQRRCRRQPRRHCLGLEQRPDRRSAGARGRARPDRPHFASRRSTSRRSWSVFRATCRSMSAAL